MIIKIIAVCIILACFIFLIIYIPKNIICLRSHINCLKSLYKTLKHDLKKEEKESLQENIISHEGNAILCFTRIMLGSVTTVTAVLFAAIIIETPFLDKIFYVCITAAIILGFIEIIAHFVLTRRYKRIKRKLSGD